jgi:hypothetical protein
VVVSACTGAVLSQTLTETVKLRGASGAQ